MMRLSFFGVDEQTKLLDLNPMMRHHSILLPDLQLRLPLHIKGIISYIPKRSPDADEGGQLYRHQLTLDTPECDPHDSRYNSQERNMVDYIGEDITRKYSKESLFGLNSSPMPEMKLNI